MFHKRVLYFFPVAPEAPAPDPGSGSYFSSRPLQTYGLPTFPWFSERSLHETLGISGFVGTTIQGFAAKIQRRDGSLEVHKPLTQFEYLYYSFT
jgi:hypothetical protein